ncbi:MAG: right-handed parallel beta-helix repeat-containing protein [Euryarchaeota archaeon]|nr:right-handed parallel beta-helix repeat-containing protein [Euryarchaeota archaeon]
MIKTRAARYLIVLTFVLPLLLMTSTMVHAVPLIPQNIIIVDKTGNGDYTTITEAVQHAEPTDIIQIQPGIYAEHTININKKISLIGTNTETCIVDCSGNPGFNLESSYVDITHLQIINSKEQAILIQSESTGCTISNCDIYPSQDNGIDMLSSYNTITNCTFYGDTMGRQAIKIQGSNNKVDRCTLQHFSNGIMIIASANDNTIINCNILNNENGVDIRMNSNNNIIINNNIYSNFQGIKIWQNSNNNVIYLNNIFKNDNDAIDENINRWDNGERGNYWNDYTGPDNDDNGIGDTPYDISTQNQDHFPITTLLLPDVIIAPTNIEHVTSTSDTTPTFNWDPAIYSKGIHGYYVTIDVNPEVFTESTTWTSSLSLTDGIHTFKIRAEGSDGKITTVTLRFKIDISLNDLDHDGWSDEDENIYGTDPTNPENYPSDTDGDHLPDTVDTDDDNDGYSDLMEFSYGTDPYDSKEYPPDLDGDKIPDEDSPDGKYTGDIDDDDDSLPDLIELQIGSNPKNGTDARKLYLGGTPYYLVDTTHTGVYTILYDPVTQKTRNIEKKDDIYLIDANGDGMWDFTYNTADLSVSSYSWQNVQLLTIGLIALFVVVIIGIFVFLIRRKRPSTKGPQDLTNRHPVAIEPEEHEIIDLYTDTTIKDTRTCLMHIQKDINRYLEQLNQINKQLKPTTEERTRIRESEIHDIEAEIDARLLEKLKMKDNDLSHR